MWERVRESERERGREGGREGERERERWSRAAKLSKQQLSRPFMLHVFCGELDHCHSIRLGGNRRIGAVPVP